MAKTIKPELLINVQTPFYSIPLVGNGFELTVLKLNEHYPVLKSDKTFKGVWAKFISFKREVATFLVTMPEEEPHYLFLHVTRCDMEVYCDCGSCNHQLCKHAYFGLRNLMFNLDSYQFEEYYWPGYTNVVNGRNKFLNIQPDRIFNIIEPLKGFGNLYRPGLGFEKGNSIQLKKQPLRDLLLERKSGHLVVGYCIVYTQRYESTSYLPIMVPYLGTTDKGGKKIVSFMEFITDEMTPSKIRYTDTQLLLNQVSVELYNIVNSMSMLNANETAERSILKQKHLELWHEAIDGGLTSQEFTHSYNTYNFKSVKCKPTKSLMKECSFSASFPFLSFGLSQKKDHYSLRAVITNGDQKLSIRHNKTPIFATDVTGTIFFAMATIQDDDLINWFSDYNNCLTILNEHFGEFHEQFLKRLSECYPVYLQSGKSKVGYNVNELRFEGLQTKILQ
jgi:hypothetical protein